MQLNTRLHLGGQRTAGGAGGGAAVRAAEGGGGDTVLERCKCVGERADVAAGISEQQAAQAVALRCVLVQRGVG